MVLVRINFLCNLNDEEKKQARELLKYFKYVNKCAECGRIYGFENKEVKGRCICHVCIYKKIPKKKKWH